MIAPRFSSTSPSSEKPLSIRATASRAELMCWAICSWVMRIVSEPVRSASARRNELTKQLRQAKLEKEKLMDAESDMTALQTRDLIDILEDGPEFLDIFDTELFGELVEKIIIESNDSVRFCLKNGLELRESIERTVR